MKKFNPADLEVGCLYADNDVVTVLRFNEETTLYNFTEMNYDEERQDYIPTSNSIRLVKMEVERLHKI